MQTTRRFWGVTILVSILLSAIAPFTAPARAQSLIDATSREVQVRIVKIRDEIESIRFTMGKPTPQGSALTVEAPTPHELYFQSLTLLKKVHQLAFELDGRSEPSAESPRGDAHMTDVKKIAGAILDSVRRISSNLHTHRSTSTGMNMPTATPATLFDALVQANRQVNLLLDKPFLPADAFQEITLALAYATRLRSADSGPATVGSGKDAP